VAVPTSHRTVQGSPLKSARERMDIIAAYREVGSYRGAAAMCGTTPKTVKRVIERHEAGGSAPPRLPRERNYEAVAELVRSRVKTTRGRISAKRLLPTARGRGLWGSARNFHRRSRRRSRRGGGEHHRGRRSTVWAPGRASGDRPGQRGRAAHLRRGAGLVAVPLGMPGNVSAGLTGRTGTTAHAPHRPAWRATP
jgi:hypothetical protein